MRDSRGRSRPPRLIAEALPEVRDRLAPKTALAGVESVWATVVGPRIAAVTTVVDERDGTVTIACESAVWAQELDLMAPQLLKKLNQATGSAGPEKLRFRAEG